jgi:hypothetical protein
VQQDRYCRSCGQQLRPQDQFCANCGRPVHANAQVPTHEADVPVPPLPQQAEDIAQTSRTPEQAAAPSPQPQQRHPWKWSQYEWNQYKWKIFVFLGSVFVSSLRLAVAEPSNAGERAIYVVAYAVGASLNTLLYFIPIWLALGGLVYLVARLLGRKPRFFRMVFDWWVTVAVVTPLLLVGFGGI